MGFSDSDLIVLFVLGKKDKLSGSKIYEESKNLSECHRRRPQHQASIFRSIQKLLKQRYLQKTDEKRVRGTVEKFYSLSEKGQSIYPEIRETILVWEFVPDSQHNVCDKCKDVDEECWDESYETLMEVVKHVFRKFNTAFDKSTMKTLFEDPGKVEEFLFWLNMLTAPKRILTAKFLPQIRALGLEQDKYFSSTIEKEESQVSLESKK